MSVSEDYVWHSREGNNISRGRRGLFCVLPQTGSSEAHREVKKMWKDIQKDEDWKEGQLRRGDERLKPQEIQ